MRETGGNEGRGRVPWAQSFRDPQSGVEFADHEVRRRLGGEAEAWFRETEASGLFEELVDLGLLVPYELREEAGETIVVSPRIPVVLYPTEWTSGMLKDAALVTLEVIQRAWDRGIRVRDATAFNIVFDGGRPVFVDHGSFQPGLTSFWRAYGQFCDEFLNPLALNAVAGISQRSVWASSLNGLGAGDLRKALGFRSLRHGLLRHVALRAFLDRRGEKLDLGERVDLRTGFGLPAEKTRKLMGRVQRVIEGLEPMDSGEWTDYETDNSYQLEESSRKAAALREMAEIVPDHQLAVDIGANTGTYAAVLAEVFEKVLAVDLAEGTVDRLYQRLKHGSLPASITPGVLDALDPTPGRGVLGAERQGFRERFDSADLFVWLAVIHHLVISRSVPLEILVQHIRGFGPRHVIEHVGPDDPMARLIAAAKTDPPWPLDVGAFEAAVSGVFRIRQKEPITAHRTLYLIEAE
jgi:hypothetical protein